ncbi:hypothetical protein CEP53_001022 [Fusarium sp. AF-6]|nr:hypothetical protein CEP53_001022 [Fusarium sp. AF-6]
MDQVCDEKRPECLACVRRGIKCSGYDRPIVFKDVSQKAAESSKKFEAARWAELKLADQEQTRRKPRQETEEKATTPVAGLSRDDDEPDDLSNAIEHVTTYSDGRDQPDWLDGFDCLQQPTFDMTFDFLQDDMTSSTPGGQGASLLGPGRAASDVPPSNDVLESCRLLVDPDLPSLVQATTTMGDNDKATSSYLTPVEEPPAFESQADLITSLTAEEPAISDLTSPSDSLPPRQAQRLATLFPEGVLESPLTTELPHSPEEALALFFQEQVAPRLPVDLEFSSLFSASRPFRAAALALSASSMQRLQGASTGSAVRLGDSHKNPWFYYRTALHELEQGLAQPRRDNNVGEIASTYLLLAYHDMEVDSPLGVRYYASLIDEMASRTELETFMTPGLFKAWRMLRCERKFLSVATRATTSSTDAWEPCSSYDNQLAIKDALINIWKFHSRYEMEASFTANVEASASKQAGQWLRATLNRECDHQQAEEGDFNEQSLDAEAVLGQCDSFDKKLDHWHCMLPERDLPVPKIGSFKDIITGPSFEPLVAYRLPDEDKAMNYVMYLLARMISSFLRSHFDQSCSAMVSETLGRTALGIVCGMNLQKRYFSMLRLHNLLLMIVLLGEGTTLSTIVLEHLIPRALGQSLPPPEKALWILLRTGVSLIAKERLRGKAIRLIISGSDGSHRPERMMQSHILAAFGDYNGRGHFREIYLVHP